MHEARGNRLARTVSLLAATIVAALIVGSMLWVFTGARSSSTNTSNKGQQTVPTPTPSAPSLPAGIYAAGDKGLFRLDPQARKVLWQANIQSSRLVATTTTIYSVTSNKSTGTSLIAIDANTGKQLWSRSLGGNNGVGALLLHNDRLYAGLSIPQGTSNPAAGKLLVFKSTDGAPLATYDFPATVQQLASDNQSLYIGTDNALIALNPANGTHLWEKPIKAHNTPMIAALQALNGSLYMSFSDDQEVMGQSSDYVAAYKTSDGSLLWQTPVLSHDTLSPFVIDHDVMYFGSMQGGAGPFSGKLFAYDIHKGAQIWSRKIDGGVQQAPVVSNGMVYADADGGNQFSSHVVALDAATGQPKWEQPVSGTIVSSLVAFNGVIYVADTYAREGKAPDALYAFNASNGNQLWQDTQYGSLNVLLPTAA